MVCPRHMQVAMLTAMLLCYTTGTLFINEARGGSSSYQRVSGGVSFECPHRASFQITSIVLNNVAVAQ